MKPVAAMWNKDYLGWSEEKREKFARLLGQLLALVDANNEGDATVHDDMAVWFRNLFFHDRPEVYPCCGCDAEGSTGADVAHLYALLVG
jgi:hypothetical protein